MSRIHWEEVGQFLKKNADKGVGLVGSLLTGNYTGAIAQGIAMVSSATGTDDPKKALAILQGDPKAMVELRRIEAEDNKSIRENLTEMHRLDLEDEQKAHSETQMTIRAADQIEKLRWVRPGLAIGTCTAGVVYIFASLYLYKECQIEIATLLLSFTGVYFGLREYGKTVIMKAMGAIGK